MTKIDSARAFRDYATRVSFNMSLSRNQVAVLRDVALFVELEPTRRGFTGQIYRDDPSVCVDHYIPGIKWLTQHGLVQRPAGAVADDERCEREKAEGKRPLCKWPGPWYEPTEAGWHVVALLRIAGLIPQPAANANAKGRKRAS